MKAFAAQRLPLLLALVAFLVSLAAALRAGLRATDGHLIYSLDDAYIHMAVAKNLARSGVWGCTPFHFSSSSSSLLWTLILGIANRLAGEGFGLSSLAAVEFEDEVARGDGAGISQAVWLARGMEERAAGADALAERFELALK